MVGAGTTNLPFLSTLSLRRATIVSCNYFPFDIAISIHALLAESDLTIMIYNTSSLIFLSTLSLRRATVKLFRQNYECFISIHALLAESDSLNISRQARAFYFYPRSPCGERLFWTTFRLSCVNFYPRSPCGERLALLTAGGTTMLISIHALLAESDSIFLHPLVLILQFLSTLSLRRATL